MNDEQLVVGLPSGSLADPNRGGNLIRLLRDAGFTTKGYDSGGPSTFPLMSYMVGWDGRPQEFGSQLALGEIDVAVGGDDWIRERTLEFKYEFSQDVELKKVLSLKRGNVRIVVIGPEATADGCDAWLRKLLKEKSLLACVSEMPYLTLEWFHKKIETLGFGKSHSGWSVQKYKTPPRISSGLVIYEAWGKTEAKIKFGSVDFGVEITQSGSSIRSYGVHVIEEVMSSEAGIWVSPSLKKSPVKYELAQMFLLNLYGSLFAEDKVLVFFNARKEIVPKIIEYLRSNNLFGDEPTINEGQNFAEFSVALDVSNAKLPLARVRYDIARMGATHIETIPIESSIPGIGIAQF